MKTLEEKADGLRYAVERLQETLLREDGGREYWLDVLGGLARVEDAARIIRARVRSRLRTSSRRECAHPEQSRHMFPNGKARCRACGKRFPAAAQVSGPR